ncbi:MAG: hypothetical protein LBP51_03135 [Deferribacteraceae bacterium]|jgi:hypothetical protein|nr:hypothetical protein [Deferribacteraceae bacterium]
MNYKKGFTLIQMAALIMIMGIALVVVARHFSASNVTESVNRYAGEADNADRELKLFLAKYRYMPDGVIVDADVDDNGAIKTVHQRFMDNNTTTTPELYKTFNPRAELSFMYVAPQIEDPADPDYVWTGDVCAVLPHTAPYTPEITPPNDSYSVSIFYCDDTSLGACNTVRMRVDGLIYAIVHPGDDGVFQSSASSDGRSLYIPSEGNDDLIRYLSVRDAYDAADCSFRVARVPKQDPRYVNQYRETTYGNIYPPKARTWVTVDEHTGNGSDCTIRSTASYSAAVLGTLDDLIYGRYGANDVGYNSLQSCNSVHLEYPVNRFGDIYASEKCCIHLNRDSLPTVFSSNCKIVYGTGSSCAVGDGKDLDGATPYIDISANPFVDAILGPVTNNLNQKPIPATLNITFRNGNRLYRINDDATILRLERCQDTRTSGGNITCE